MCVATSFFLVTSIAQALKCPPVPANLKTQGLHEKTIGGHTWRILVEDTSYPDEGIIWPDANGGGYVYKIISNSLPYCQYESDDGFVKMRLVTELRYICDQYAEGSSDLCRTNAFKQDPNQPGGLN